VLKKISLLPEAPLRPEARGICHICHTVNPALVGKCGGPFRDMSELVPETNFGY